MKLSRVGRLMKLAERDCLFEIDKDHSFQIAYCGLQNCATNLASSSSPSCSQARVERRRGWSQIFFNTFSSANGDRVLINICNMVRTIKFLFTDLVFFCLTSIVVHIYMKYREVVDNYFASQVCDMYVSRSIISSIGMKCMQRSSDPD